MEAELVRIGTSQAEVYGSFAGLILCLVVMVIYFWKRCQQQERRIRELQDKLVAFLHNDMLEKTENRDTFMKLGFSIQSLSDKVDYLHSGDK